MTRNNTLADHASSANGGYHQTTQQRIIHDGVEQLGDADLLAVVLGGERPARAVLAAGLLEDHGGVGGLLRTGVGQLAQHRGVGPAKAMRIASAIELGRRAVAAAALEASPRLCEYSAVVTWAQPKLAVLDHEELWVLALDGRQGLRAARRVASGGIHGLHVGVRDVLRIGLREAAGAILMVHNHPSGDPLPSQEDVTFTRAVAEGAAVVRTPLVDHVIIARERSSSLLALGLMPSVPATD